MVLIRMGFELSVGGVDASMGGGGVGVLVGSGEVTMEVVDGEGVCARGEGSTSTPMVEVGHG